jgi:glutamate formiminotransferase/formiminotetrahydrofolate cyclodeaminase
VEVGARALEMGIWGAYKNVLINMPQIKDEEYKASTLATAEEIVKRSQEKSREVLRILEKRATA